ncbi:hypothetical protein D9M71_626150 [compost metagenome]
MAQVGQALQEAIADCGDGHLADGQRFDSRQWHWNRWQLVQIRVSQIELDHAQVELRFPGKPHPVCRIGTGSPGPNVRSACDPGLQAAQGVMFAFQLLDPLQNRFITPEQFPNEVFGEGGAQHEHALAAVQRAQTHGDRFTFEQAGAAALRVAALGWIQGYGSEPGAMHRHSQQQSRAHRAGHGQLAKLLVQPFRLVQAKAQALAE